MTNDSVNIDSDELTKQKEAEKHIISYEKTKLLANKGLNIAGKTGQKIYTYFKSKPLTEEQKILNARRKYEVEEAKHQMFVEQIKSMPQKAFISPKKQQPFDNSFARGLSGGGNSFDIGMNFGGGSNPMGSTKRKGKKNKRGNDDVFGLRGFL